MARRMIYYFITEVCDTPAWIQSESDGWVHCWFFGARGRFDQDSTDSVSRGESSTILGLHWIKSLSNPDFIFSKLITKIFRANLDF